MHAREAARHVGATGGALVAPPEKPGQAVQAHQVLRERVEVYLLLLQLLLRDHHSVGQGVVVGHRSVLYWVPSSG